MTTSPFHVGHQYTRADVYEHLGVPRAQQRGNWETGYNFFRDACYVFANVGVPGRTGHDYGNRIIGEGLEQLEWFAKARTRLAQPQIRRLLDPRTPVLLFFRTDSRSAFTFAGAATVVQSFDETPVRVIWRLADADDVPTGALPEEAATSFVHREGAIVSVRVNRYERSRIARMICVRAHGLKCVVCGFDFEARYGDRGRDFIVVHHLVSLAAIGKEYEVNPVKDLRPVCANCHSMIHRTEPPASPDEVRAMLRPSGQSNVQDP